MPGKQALFVSLRSTVHRVMMVWNLMKTLVKKNNSYHLSVCACGESIIVGSDPGPGGGDVGALCSQEDGPDASIAEIQSCHLHYL